MNTQLSAAQRLIVALDVETPWDATDLVKKLSPVVTTFKVGYWLLLEPRLQQLMSDLKRRDVRVFLDAKLNDIPETVKRGVASAAKLGADFVTVHSDEAMLRAAMDGKGNKDIKVMAVTALTSMSEGGSRDRFRAGLLNAIITGCDGLIMSPADLLDPVGKTAQGTVRSLAGDMIIATPGVRLAGNRRDDHQRIGSPDNAIRDGADYLIIGRPIIEAPDPLEAAQKFIAIIEAAESKDAISAPAEAAPEPETKDSP